MTDDKELTIQPADKSAVSVTEQTQAMMAQASQLMGNVIELSSSPNFDLDKFERLMKLAEAMQAKVTERQYYAALNRVQAKLEPVRADLNNNQTKSKYASFAALDAACRKAYSDEGFSLENDTGPVILPDGGRAPNEIRILLKIVHEAGFSRTLHIDLPADGKGPSGGDVMTRTHATTSAVTYGRKALIEMAFNLAVQKKVDDDGNAAGSQKVSEQQTADIQSLISEHGFDEAKALAHYKLESWADLPLKNFEAVCRDLQAKGKAKAQKK